MTRKNFKWRTFFNVTFIIIASIRACLPDRLGNSVLDPVVDRAVQFWQNVAGPVQAGTDAPQHPQRQKTWDEPGSKATMQGLIDAASTEPDRARLLAVSTPHSSDWLNALPAASLGMKLENTQPSSGLR